MSPSAPGTPRCTSTCRGCLRFSGRPSRPPTASSASTFGLLLNSTSGRIRYFSFPSAARIRSCRWQDQHVGVIRLGHARTGEQAQRADADDQRSSHRCFLPSQRGFCSRRHTPELFPLQIRDRAGVGAGADEPQRRGHPCEGGRQARGDAPSGDLTLRLAPLRVAPGEGSGPRRLQQPDWGAYPFGRVTRR
jgi:hypothetical protein